MRCPVKVPAGQGQSEAKDGDPERFIREKFLQTVLQLSIAIRQVSRQIMQDHAPTRKNGITSREKVRDPRPKVFRKDELMFSDAL